MHRNLPATVTRGSASLGTCGRVSTQGYQESFRLLRGRLLEFSVDPSPARLPLGCCCFLDVSLERRLWKGVKGRTELVKVLCTEEVGVSGKNSLGCKWLCSSPPNHTKGT